MKNKQEKIRELRNLIHQLTFDRKAMRDKKDRIQDLRDELDELQLSLDLELYTEDSQPTNP